MKKEIWANPKNEHSLNESQTPFWFWNDKLEKDEIVRQLKLKTEKGVTCTIPHARSLWGDGYIGGYLDDDWFDKIGAVVNYKRENGEPFWIYDEIDWPSGTCNQTITKDESLREQYLIIRTEEIPAGTTFNCDIKDIDGKNMFNIKEGDSLDDYVLNVAVIDKESLTPYKIQDYIAYKMFGAEFEITPERDALAFIITCCTDTYKNGGSGSVSYINKKATEKYIESTHEKYYERYADDFGKTITGVFNDETRFCHSLVWSEDFAKEFAARKGYSINHSIYKLILPDEDSGRLRCDYFDVLADLYKENYFGVLHKWCSDHGINFFAHLLGEETPYGHVRYSGDYLRQNKEMDIAGADHLGKGIGSLNIKYTACAGHSYGKKLAGVEIFAGCGWDFTFEEYLRMITWVFSQGMNIIINHGFFYSTRDKRKDDWPPSQFFQWQGWDRMSEGNDMVRRLHYAFTDGVPHSPVLIYQPTESMWLSYLPNHNFTHAFEKGPIIKNDRAQKLDREIQLLQSGLQEQNLDYDLIHKDAVCNFKAENGKIVNTLSGQSFDVLVLPMCKVLPSSMIGLCEEFLNQGGKIIALEEMPCYALPMADDKKLLDAFSKMQAQEGFCYLPIDNKDEIYKAVRNAIDMPIEIIDGVSTNKNNHPAYPSYLIDPYIHTGEDLSGVMFNSYLKDGKRNTLFMNYSNTPETITVKVKGADKSPEIWDTFTGEIKEAQVVARDIDSVSVTLTLPCNYGVILVS